MDKNINTEDYFRPRDYFIDDIVKIKDDIRLEYYMIIKIENDCITLIVDKENEKTEIEINKESLILVRGGEKRKLMLKELESKLKYRD